MSECTFRSLLLAFQGGGGVSGGGGKIAAAGEQQGVGQCAPAGGLPDLGGGGAGGRKQCHGGSSFAERLFQ